MDDIKDVVCAFCGSIMGLSRETPASAETHALRFFTCATCGASEVRIERTENPEGSPGGLKHSHARGLMKDAGP